VQVENITIDTLVFSLLVDVVETTEHFYGGDMRASIIDDALRPMFNQILEKLQGL
jgi:hypothetical protein